VSEKADTAEKAYPAEKANKADNANKAIMMVCSGCIGDLF